MINQNYHEKASTWIHFLEDLQDLGIEDKQFTIPQIAVFGDQSSGKSSLLESISGIPFPKGVGLVTKCPTRISMIRTPNVSWEASITLPKTYSNAEITRTVTNPEELSDLLAKASQLITSGSGNGFSQDCIHVGVRSPDVPNLSLIDLPGIIRTTTTGQDRSVIASVDNLLAKYMSQPETIILAIIPSNQDIATIDILERAHKYDPSGERTIGVLTKPDLIDRGAEEEIVQVIKNLKKPLKLGYIIVKNRNQLELQSQLSLQDGLKAESQYFDSHPVWSTLSSSSRGISSLCEKLSQLILIKAQSNASSLKSALIAKQKEAKTSLQGLGENDIPNTYDTQRKLLIKIITRFNQVLRQISSGEYRDIFAQHDSSLHLKYLMTNILQALESTLQGNIPNLYTDEYVAKLTHGMDDMRGRELPGFASTRILLSTVAEELDTWRGQVEDAIRQLFDSYSETANLLSQKLTLQFPNLCKGIQEVIFNILMNYKDNMKLRVDEMFLYGTEGASTDQQLIETINNLRFSRFEQTLQEVLIVAKESEPGKGTKEELKTHILDMLGFAYVQHHSIGTSQMRIEEARAVLTAYWNICEKKINEDISSACDVVLLQQCSEAIEKDLFLQMQNWIANEELLKELFLEDIQVRQQRQTWSALVSNIDRILTTYDGLLSSY